MSLRQELCLGVFCSVQLCPGQSLFEESVICGAGQEEILVDAFPHRLSLLITSLMRSGRVLSTARSAGGSSCLSQVHPMFLYIPWREPCRAACTVECLQEKCWAEVTEKF